MKYILAAIATSFALVSPAMAHDRHRDDDRRHERHERWDDRRDHHGRDHWRDRRDERDYRDGYRDGRRDARRHWRRGERIERNYYRSNMVVIGDWEYRRYGLRQPPRGTFYLRDRDGSIVLVAIGNSVVVSVIR